MDQKCIFKTLLLNNIAFVDGKLIKHPFQKKMNQKTKTILGLK